MDTIAKSYLLCLVLGAFYHLTSPSHPCRVTSQENDTVDIICQYREGFVTSSPQGMPLQCTSQKVIWQRSDYHLATNLTDNTKYGVWEAVPGWQIQEDQRVSLLRVRNVNPQDMGLYQCRIQCHTEGRIHVNYHLADLCIENHQPGYAICGTRTLDNKCSWAFGNSVCDPECDNEENLFDGFDCASTPLECPRRVDDECREAFANGVCDQRCDSAACAWDGGDCIDRPLVFASDKIVLTLASWYQRSGKTIDVKVLGRRISKLLRTIVRIMPEGPPTPGHRGASSSGGGRAPGEAAWHRPDVRGYDPSKKIYLKIDNTMCHRRCFRSAQSAAQFIDLALKNKWDPGIPIASIGVLSRVVNKCELENNTLLHIDLPVSPNPNSNPNSNPNIYSFTYAKTSDGELPPTWLLVTASIGGVVIIVLILVIVVIIYRIRKLSKEERHRAVAEVERIQDGKTAVSQQQGTDV